MKLFIFGFIWLILTIGAFIFFDEHREKGIKRKVVGFLFIGLVMVVVMSFFVFGAAKELAALKYFFS